MSRRPHLQRSRRGIALLLVLATLVLAVTAAAGLARVATAARLHAESARRAIAADALLDAAEAPILDWLHRHAGRTVLPPEATSPRVAVLDDEIEFGGQQCRLTITAFDQCGMVPPSWGASGRGTMLPTDILKAMERAGEALTEHPGLDLLDADRPTYPGAEERPVPAVGELLATHNPPRPGRPPAVNINTAPIPLLHALYAARGLGGLEAVLEARAAGRVASPGALSAPRTDDDIPLPVAMSGAWAFRIDCVAGGLHRSWWCVYADTGSNWERVQRLAIDE
jgi:hypothetical protein